MASADDEVPGGPVLVIEIAVVEAPDVSVESMHGVVLQQHSVPFAPGPPSRPPGHAGEAGVSTRAELMSARNDDHVRRVCPRQ